METILEHATQKESDHSIRSAFAEFLNQPLDYRMSYLQSRYKTAFDGYSFMGQNDSLNQYDTDMLHSFVLSNLQENTVFPKEFQGFLQQEWPRIIDHVRELELDLIAQKKLPFKELYDNDCIAYMMSCNYYPALGKQSIKPTENKRLSTHTDVSLFTTFPFGISKGFSFNDQVKLNQIEKQEQVFSFYGYFSEFVSQGAIKALNHQVELPENLDSERFSFAVFSIPKPTSRFLVGDRETSGNGYYSEYLSLF
jgi:hypothetical protein